MLRIVYSYDYNIENACSHSLYVMARWSVMAKHTNAFRIDEQVKWRRRNSRAAELQKIREIISIYMSSISAQ